MLGWGQKWQGFVAGCCGCLLLVVGCWLLLELKMLKTSQKTSDKLSFEVTWNDFLNFKF